ncbi:hypothetical protein CLOHYLEM_05250 [[Clostridium] hylemonae DSM 15053]|uniref:Uncharacterized protein n=1 Tax=[Clostridium] hylemonae DSM 15053 TaxID=553973 RepID=C0BZK9_9FIRM|nr:hypothetical protein CLOHYLEM_05250 [[Clostridium] hylemonae DSM 15053]
MHIHQIYYRQFIYFVNSLLLFLSMSFYFATKRLQYACKVKRS